MKWIDPRVDHKYCRKNRGGQTLRKPIPWFTRRTGGQLMGDKAWAVVLFVLLMVFMINLIGGLV